MIEKILLIANEAGEIIREGFGQNVDFEFKSNDKDIVTEIDKKAEETIIGFINKEFPNHSILAEESGTQNNNSEYTWVIDPLDGTTNFKHGLPIFSVSIGIMKEGETIWGVVYDVMQNIFYSAEKGSGAFANDKKLQVSENPLLEKALLVTGFPYDIPNNPHYAIERFGDLVKTARGVRRLGSAAIDFCYVAAGVFDGFWEVFLHPWDICAGKLIVEESGGIVTDFKGKKIDIFSNQILATNNKISPEMIELLSKWE